MRKTLLFLCVIGLLIVSCGNNKQTRENKIIDSNGLEYKSVTNPTTGKKWLDRNLGASQVATSSTDILAYGDLYQWGRGADGHQLRKSSTRNTLSKTDDPGHGDFITDPIPEEIGLVDFPWDWRFPQNDNLWQGVNGDNNPCPNGYRLPTEEEWEVEIATWVSDDASGAFNSPLKLPVSGYRSYSYISKIQNSSALYWSSTVGDTYSVSLYFNYNEAGISANHRANGFSVRCIKD